MTRRLGLLASTLVACGLALAIALPSTAVATSPISGDDRATAYPGNAVDCDDAGLAGQILQGVTYFTNIQGTHLAITSVPSGFEVTGIVVKGSNAYNVYPPQYRLGLHAPLNDGGQIPQISHWYVCGQPPGTTTTTSTSPTSPTSTTTPTESTTSDTSTSESTTSESESTSSSPGATTTPGGGGSGDVGDDELAETGFSGRGLLVAGGGLLLLGLALVLGVRASRRQA